MSKYFFVETVPQATYALQFYSGDGTFVTNSDAVRKFLLWFGIKHDQITESTKGILNSDIYFFCKCWKIDMFMKIKKLSKLNTIYYYQRKPYTSIKSTSPKNSIIELLFSFLCDIDIEIIKEGNIDVIQLSDLFFSKNNIKIRYEEANFQNDIIKEKLKPLVGNNKILVLLSDLSEYDWISKNKFLEFNRMIQKTLENNDYLVKFHPNDKEGWFGYQKERIIPSFIPAEFLFNFNWVLVIGIESYSLVLAGTTPTVVSCLDMLNFSEKVNLDCHRFLDSESKHILFPKDIPEFETIVKETLK